MSELTGKVVKTIECGHHHCDEHFPFPLSPILRLQTWLSPAFPTGAYSYSHGLERAVEAGYINDRKSLVDFIRVETGGDA